MSHDGKGNIEDVALTSHGAEKGSPELRPQEEECVAGEGGGDGEGHFHLGSELLVRPQQVL